MSTRARRIERAIAAAVCAVPLWYLLSEHSRDVALFNWSWAWSALVAVTVALYAALLASYSVERPSWIEKPRRIALLLGASTLFSLAGAEAALRALDRPAFEELDNSGRHAPDPDVGHVYVPNHRQTLQTREYRVEWSSNAQGVRAERDFGPKSPAVRRIVCVGDSFTAGDQVPYRETWPAVLESELEQRLRRAGSELRVEVVNAGIPGFSTANEAAWIAKFGARFEPDLVLLGLTPNDLLENQFPLQYTARDGMLVASRSTEADRLRFEHRRNWWCLAGVVERSSLRQRFDASPVVRRMLGRPLLNHAEAYQHPPGEKSERLYALMERYVLDARAAAAALGARFGLVVIPYRSQLRPMPAGFERERYGRHWSAFAQTQGFLAADALPAFLAHPEPQTLFWKEDTHCTAAGYALVGQRAAQAVWEQREALGWTP